MNKQLKGSNPNPATAKRLTCKDMAKILIKTYNPSIIDSFTPKLRTACEKEALEIISNSDNYMHGRRRGRKVLAKLISNRKNLPYQPEQVDFVGGPYNITHHWSNKYKKEIYIWGEWHDKIIDCLKQEDYPSLKIMNIEDFLHNIFFINPIVFSDFYLEIEAHLVPNGYKKYEYDPNRLLILRSLFANCIGPNRDLDKLCDNSRMHFFDIRQGKVRWGMNSACLFQNEIISFLSYANSKLKEHEDKFYDDHPELDKSNVWDEYCYDFTFLDEITNFVERWKSFFIFFALFDNNYEDTKLNYKKFWYDQIYNFKLIAKEITVMHTDVKPLLNIFIKKELDSLLRREHIKFAEYSKRVLYIYESIRKYLHTPVYTLKYREIKELIDSIDSVKVRVLGFNTLLSDAYLLARIFKTFKVDDRFAYNPRKTDEPAEPHNIVIYAGNSHSQRYRRFLNYLGFNLIEQSGELGNPSGIYKNCVDMRYINQPFFSKWNDIEDQLMDEKYFDNFELYFSFESVFRFYAPEGFIPFDQPVVPIDLVSEVSINDRKYVVKPKMYTLYTRNPYDSRYFYR